MGVISVCFDDPSDEELSVFSGSDLLVTHYDGPDLDWQEVAERSELDQRRGLVIAQVAVLEDLIDEFLAYLLDPADPAEFATKLDAMTIVPRIAWLRSQLKKAQLLDDETEALIDELDRVAQRRNELAHGTLQWRLVAGQSRLLQDLLSQREIELEWIMTNRRTRSSQRITMLELRQNLYDAIGVFTAMLGYAEVFVQRAPQPTHFKGGRYLGAPTP
jgi:hypothetical protein